MKLIKGHFYKCNDKSDNTIFIGQYMGREKHFECQVCGGGHNAHCFNLYHTKGEWSEYECFSYGTEHLPEIIEDLGQPAEPILMWPEEARV